MKAAVYFLLLTSLTWISVVNSICYCSNETFIDIHEFKNSPLPSIFVSQPSTFPVSLPLLTTDELLQQHNVQADVHPFEDLWEFISFMDGSSVYYIIDEFDVDPFISDIKENLPTVSEIKESAAPIIDAVEEKVAPIVSSVKDTVAPVISTLKKEVSSFVSKAEDPIIPESYKYGMEYTKNAQERVTPIISAVEDGAATVMSFVEEEVASVVNIVEEKITPYISDTESEEDDCESFSFSKFLPNVELMTNNMEEGEEEMTIPDEDDYVLITFKFVGDEEVEHDATPSDGAAEVTPTHDEIKRSRYVPILRGLFKLLSILAVGLVAIISMLYLFVLSIVIYVFVKDYFAERYDADANEHFRELLNQIRNEHKFCRRPQQQQLALVLPAPKKDQDQQTNEEEEDDDDESVASVSQAEIETLEVQQPVEEEVCSSEADVSMDDTTSHSCA